MKANELIQRSANFDDGTHERKIGRYYCSEVYAIRKRYLTPAKFFEKKEADLEGAMNIEGGKTDEEGFARILKNCEVKFEHEPKKELKIADGVVIVVKPDFIINEKVLLETKSPAYITTEIPEKWMDQLECEYRAFNLPVYLGVFRNNDNRRFSLSEYKYEPSDTRWKEIINLIINFDGKLKKISAK
jgi:hypothetical protein